MAGAAGAAGAVRLAPSVGVQLRSGKVVSRAQAQERVPVADTCGQTVLSASKRSDIISKPENNSGVIFSEACSEVKNSNIQPVDLITLPQLRDVDSAPEASSDVFVDCNNMFSLLAVLTEAETGPTAAVLDSSGQARADRFSAVHQRLAELAVKAGDPTVQPPSAAAAAARVLFMLLHPGGGQRAASALFTTDADGCAAMYARCFSEWQQEEATRSQAVLGGASAATPPGSETRGRSLQREAAAQRSRREISARAGGRRFGRERRRRGSAAALAGAGKALPRPRPCAPPPPPLPAVGRSSREWPRPRTLPSAPLGEGERGPPWVTVGKNGKALREPWRAGTSGPQPPPFQGKCGGTGGPGLKRLPVPRPAAGAGLKLAEMQDDVHAPRASHVLVASRGLEPRDGASASGASNVAASGVTCRCGGGPAGGGGTRAEEEVLLDRLLRTHVELASKHRLEAAAATAAAAVATAAAQVAAASAAQLAAQRQLVMQMMESLGGATVAGAWRGVGSGALRCLGGG